MGVMQRAFCGMIAIGLCAIIGTGIAEAEIFGGENVRATFKGRLTPHALPRSSSLPVALRMEGGLISTNGKEPPRLLRIAIAINRHGRLSTVGLPVCPLRSLEATTTQQALAACSGALVGRGRFTAHIALPSQAPFPAAGKMLVFNSVLHGRHVMLAHIYGTSPVPTSRVLVMTYQRSSGGTFGTTLSFQMPNLTVNWGYATSFRLTLHRNYTYRGRPRSLISASCPAPKGLGIVLFTAAKGTYYLGDGRKISRVLEGTCAVSR
jgi:hypothetical protein